VTAILPINCNGFTRINYFPLILLIFVMFRYYVMFLNLVIFEKFKLYVKIHAMISKLSQVILLFLLC